MSNNMSLPVLPLLGVCVILAAAAVAFISSRSKSQSSSSNSRVYDPYGISAFVANGSLPNTDKRDTVVNVAVRFESSGGGVPSRDKILELFKLHVIPHQQFHGLPDTSGGTGEISWRPVSGGINTDAHFIDHASADNDETMKIVEKLMNDTTRIRSEGLSKGLPWWRVHIIREGAGGKGTIVIQVHHCIGDGVSLLNCFGKLLTSDAKGATPFNAEGIFNPGGGKRSLEHGSGEGGGGGGGLSFITRTLIRPWRWPMALLGMIDFAVCFVDTALKPIGPYDTPTPFVPANQKQWPPSGDSIIIPMGTHSLDLIKKIKNHAGTKVTVNDVEFAIYAGMMRRYLMQHCNWSPEQVAAARLRSMTPLAIPHKVSPNQIFTHTMANQFTFMLTPLPVAERSAKERVLKAHSIWQVFKTRSYVPASFALTKLSGILPIEQRRQTCLDLFQRHSVVFSNVPGPAHDVFIGGSKVSGISSYYVNVVPQVIVVSYAGEMHYSLVMQPMGKPGGASDCRIALPKCFQEELDELKSAFNVQ